MAQASLEYRGEGVVTDDTGQVTMKERPYKQQEEI